MPPVSVGSSAMPRPGTVQSTGDRIEAVYSIVDDARRNHLITLTYSELSTALRALIGPHASWCTFSTWSSRTVGYFIRGDIDPLTRLPAQPAARSGSAGSCGSRSAQFNRLTSRIRKRAAPRLLARGNREIFAEIAREFARFVAEFDDRTERDDERWRRYRASIMPAPPTEVFPAADVELMRRWVRGLLRRALRAGHAAPRRARAARQHPARRLRAAACRPHRALRAEPLPEPTAQRRPRRSRTAHRERRQTVGAPGQGPIPNVDRRHVRAHRHTLEDGDRPACRSSARAAQRVRAGRARPAEARRG